MPKVNLTISDLQKRYHFVVFPYLNMRVKEWDLGFVKIWNFDLLKESYIPDHTLREKVAEVLADYNGFQGRGGAGVMLLNAEDVADNVAGFSENINQVQLLLFICTLAKHNTLPITSITGQSMFSSENFECVRFSVSSQSDYVTEEAQFVVPNFGNTIKICDRANSRSRQVLTPFNQSMDEALLSVLLRLRTKKPVVFQRLMSAIGIFYQSYYNAPQLGQKIRITLQASAFEVMMGVRSGVGADALKACLKKHSIRQKRKYKESLSEKGVEVLKYDWVKKFFSLRNAIVRGYALNQSEFSFRRQRHFDIALYFFVFTLKRVLERSLRKQLFNDAVVWKTWEDSSGVQSVKHTGFGYDLCGQQVGDVTGSGWSRKQAALKI